MNETLKFQVHSSKINRQIYKLCQLFFSRITFNLKLEYPIQGGITVIRNSVDNGVSCSCPLGKYQRDVFTNSSRMILFISLILVKKKKRVIMLPRNVFTGKNSEYVRYDANNFRRL